MSSLSRKFQRERSRSQSKTKRLALGMIASVDAGPCYYRNVLIKRYMDKRDDVDALCTYVTNADLFECEVVYLAMPGPTNAPIEFIENLKKRNIAVVVDCDDDLASIPDWSPAHAPYVGDQKMVEYYKQLHPLADVITTPSRYLASCLRERTGADIEIIENAFDTHYKIFRPHGKLAADATPCIGWCGGQQHSLDIEALKAVWFECIKREIGLQYIGDLPDAIAKDESAMKSGLVKVISASRSPEYYFQALAIARFDVLLAPLIDIQFNRCKSALKPIEYMFLSGSTVVASDLTPYDDLNFPRLTKIKGFDKDEWMAAIENGIQIMREQGRSYALDSKYTMDVAIVRWMEVFRAAVRKVRNG